MSTISKLESDVRAQVSILIQEDSEQEENIRNTIQDTKLNSTAPNEENTTRKSSRLIIKNKTEEKINKTEPMTENNNVSSKNVIDAFKDEKMDDPGNEIKDELEMSKQVSDVIDMNLYKNDAALVQDIGNMISNDIDVNAECSIIEKMDECIGAEMEKVLNSRPVVVLHSQKMKG